MVMRRESDAPSLTIDVEEYDDWINAEDIEEEGDGEGGEPPSCARTTRSSTRVAEEAME